MKKGETLEDKPIEKVYWSTSEVSEELKVPESAIRFWCKAFNLRVKINRHFNRMFTVSDRIKLREIYYLLKVEGLTIWGAKKKLDLL